MFQASRVSRCVLCLSLMAGAGAAFAAGPFELISRVDRAPDRFGDSGGVSLSADGRYMAFVSKAGNLVPGAVDDNSGQDVFFRDRLTGITTLVTHASGSPDTAAPSSTPHPYAQVSLSADGRYLAFVSTADDLAPGVTDANDAPDAFLWDRVTGTTTLISHAAGRRDVTGKGSSYEVRISADGRTVALLSGASDLAPRQTAPAGLPVLANLFLWSRSSGALTLVTWRAGSSRVTAHGYAGNPRLSADGRFVAFDDTADDLVPGQTRSVGDSTFLYDRSSGKITLVSHAAADPRSPASNLSQTQGLSADGRWLLFVSYGTNVIPGQTGTVPNLFLYDRTSGVTRLIGAGVAGGVMSTDGRWVAFSKLPDTQGTMALVLYDRVAGTSTPVAQAPGAPDIPGSAVPMGLSADGRFLVYIRDYGKIFLFDRTTGASALANHVAGSADQVANGSSYDPPAISANGGVVVFASRATDLGDGLNDPSGFQSLFGYDRRSGEVSLLTPADPENPALSPAAESGAGDLSADGRYVAFLSGGGDLVPGQINHYSRGPVGGFWSFNVFLHDRVTKRMTLLSRAGSTGADRVTTTGGYRPVLSADGRVAAFLGSTDPNSPAFKLMVYDVVTDVLTLAQHQPGQPGMPDAGSATERPAVSADGRYIAYTCLGCILVPSQEDGHPNDPHATDLFLYDRVADTHALVSHASGAAATPGNATSTDPGISADGRWVVFTSKATDLAPGGTPLYQPNVYLFDRDAGAVTLVSHALGSAGSSDGSSIAPQISADGRWIYYLSSAGNLAPGQPAVNGVLNLFLYDRTTGANVLVSRPASSRAAKAAFEPWDNFSVSADGRWLAFLATSTNLVPGGTDSNQDADVFLYDRVSRSIRLVSHAAGAPTRAANRGSLRVRISADGGKIAFLSAATDLVPGPTPPEVALYVEDRATGALTRIAPVHDSFRLPVLTWVPFEPRLSADGSTIAFTGGLPLPSGDFNGTWDVYVAGSR